MVTPAQPRPVALAHNQIGNSGAWTPAVENDNSWSSPATTEARGMLGPVEVPMPPPTSAEIEQARVFERILQAEFAHLNKLAYAMAGPLDRHRHPNLDGGQPSAQLLRIHARIDEVHRLLMALQGRFPRTILDGELQPE